MSNEDISELIEMSIKEVTQFIKNHKNSKKINE
jgi:hypothetical protein